MAKRVSPTGGFFYSSPTIARRTPSAFIKCAPPTITRRKPPTITGHAPSTITRRKPPTIARRTASTITRRVNQTATCPPWRKAFLRSYPTDHPIIQFLLRTNQPPPAPKHFFSSFLFLFLFTWLFLLGSCYLALFTWLFKTTLILPLSCPHLTLSRFQTLTRFFQPTTLLFSRSPIAHSFTIHNSPPPDQSPPSSITHHPSPTKKKDTAPTEPHPDITSHFLHIYRSYGANQRTRIMHI